MSRVGADAARACRGNARRLAHWPHDSTCGASPQRGESVASAAARTGPCTRRRSRPRVESRNRPFRPDGPWRRDPSWGDGRVHGRWTRRRSRGRGTLGRVRDDWMGTAARLDIACLLPQFSRVLLAGRRGRERRGIGRGGTGAAAGYEGTPRFAGPGSRSPVIGPCHRTVFTRPPDSRKRRRSAFAKRLRLSMPGSGRIGNVRALNLRRMVDSEHRRITPTSRMVSTSGRASRRTRASVSMQ